MKKGKKDTSSLTVKTFAITVIASSLLYQAYIHLSMSLLVVVFISLSACITIGALIKWRYFKNKSKKFGKKHQELS